MREILPFDMEYPDIGGCLLYTSEVQFLTELNAFVLQIDNLLLVLLAAKTHVRHNVVGEQ